MRRTLVVANRTLGGAALTAAMAERAQQEWRVHVVVPVVPSDRYRATVRALSASAGGAFDEAGTAQALDAALLFEGDADGGTGHGLVDEEGQREARQRLAAALEGLRGLGASATGEVGDPDPVRAVTDVLHRDEFDEILLSTLPAGASRWLRMDLPSRLRRRSGLPVTHVIGEPGDR